MLFHFYTIIMIGLSSLISSCENCIQKRKLYNLECSTCLRIFTLVNSHELDPDYLHCVLFITFYCKYNWVSQHFSASCFLLVYYTSWTLQLEYMFVQVAPEKNGEIAQKLQTWEASRGDKVEKFEGHLLSLCDSTKGKLDRIFSTGCSFLQLRQILRSKRDGPNQHNPRNGSLF